jgi:enoyl-CoA hydratase
MPFDTITYEKTGGIGVVTLNRPRVYNAINARCREELRSALDDSARDKSIRVLIITGHENFFSAGADISEIKEMTSAASATNFSQEFQRLFQKIEELKKPVIAAVSGFALGGGCELALSCDLRILSENASFGVPEIDIGAFPAGGGTQKLPRLIGLGKAKEMLFTGERISAQEAYRIGIANKVVADGEYLNESKGWAEKLRSKSPSAITMIKRLVKVGIDMDIDSALAFESENFGTLSTHRDFKEGVSAFLEKRKAVYKGD